MEFVGGMITGGIIVFFIMMIFGAGKGDKNE